MGQLVRELEHKPLRIRPIASPHLNLRAIRLIVPVQVQTPGVVVELSLEFPEQSPIRLGSDRGPECVTQASRTAVLKDLGSLIDRVVIQIVRIPRVDFISKTLLGNVLKWIRGSDLNRRLPVAKVRDHIELLGSPIRAGLEPQDRLVIHSRHFRTFSVGMPDPDPRRVFVRVEGLDFQEQLRLIVVIGTHPLL